MFQKNLIHETPKDLNPGSKHLGPCHGVFCCPRLKIFAGRFKRSRNVLAVSPGPGFGKLTASARAIKVPVQNSCCGEYQETISGARFESTSVNGIRHTGA